MTTTLRDPRTEDERDLEVLMDYLLGGTQDTTHNWQSETENLSVLFNKYKQQENGKDGLGKQSGRWCFVSYCTVEAF